jgi:DNA polymerase III subunit delta
MTYVEVIQEIKKNNFSPLYLLFGSETYLIQELQEKISKGVIPKNDADLNITIMDLEETPIQDAILDAETFPFIGEKKVLILKNASFFKATAAKSKVEHDLTVLEEYLSQPVEYTIIIFIAPYEKIDERRKIVKKIKEHGRVVNCEPIKEWDLSKWIDLLAKQMEVHITEDAKELIIQEVGTELMAIQKELEKFSLSLTDSKTITKDIVEKLVFRNSESSVFKLIDGILQRDLSKAINIFRELMKRKEEPIALLALLASQIRLILQCKLFKNQGYSSQQMAKHLKSHPYAIKMALEREKYFSEKKLYEMISHITETDEMMKRGEMEKELAFELLIHHFISAKTTV